MAIFKIQIIVMLYWDGEAVKGFNGAYFFVFIFSRKVLSIFNLSYTLIVIQLLLIVDMI